MMGPYPSSPQTTGVWRRSVPITAAQKASPCSLMRSNSATGTSLPRATPCRSGYRTRTDVIGPGAEAAGSPALTAGRDFVCMGVSSLSEMCPAGCVRASRDDRRPPERLGVGLDLGAQRVEGRTGAERAAVDHQAPRGAPRDRRDDVLAAHADGDEALAVLLED